VHTIPSKGQVLLQIVILCDFDVTYVNKLEIMATLIGFCWCPSELSNTSAVAASHEGQLAIVTNDGVFVLVSYKIRLCLAHGSPCAFDASYSADTGTIDMACVCLTVTQKKISVVVVVVVVVVMILSECRSKRPRYPDHNI